jgi:hypothetical protein
MRGQAIFSRADYFPVRFPVSATHVSFPNSYSRRFHAGFRRIIAQEIS